MSVAPVGILYRLVQWFLRVVPVDAAGRRVLDETLADWRRERGNAHTPLGQMIVALRSCAGVLRGLLLVSIREVRSREGGAAFVRLAAWTAAGLAIFLVFNWELLYVTVEGGGALWGYDTLGLLSVSWLAGVMPILAFLSAAFARNSRSPLPRLGPALVVGGLMVLVMGWAVPIAGQAIREITFVRSGGVGVIPPGVSELSLVELVGRVTTLDSPQAASHLNFRVLWMIAVPIMLTLGTTARGTFGWRRLAGTLLPLAMVGLPFVRVGWPNRLYLLWGALLTVVLLMRLLTAAAKNQNQNTTDDGSLAGAGGVTS